jgi:hypothetical protein
MQGIIGLRLFSLDILEEQVYLSGFEICFLIGRRVNVWRNRVHLKPEL